MLLAGVGNIDHHQRRNYFVVDASNCPSEPSLISLETQKAAIEESFKDLTTRRDVAILLINQHVRPGSLVN